MARSVAVLAWLCALALLLLCGGARAAVMSVDQDAPDTTDADGACSLREAIENGNANANVHGDCGNPSGTTPVTIRVPALSVAGALPTITRNMLIQGSGAASVVRGYGTQGLLTVNADVTLQDLTLQDGDNTNAGEGGCVTVRGGNTLELIDATLAGCRADVIGLARAAGGVFVESGATLLADGATFDHCHGQTNLHNVSLAVQRNMTRPSDQVFAAGGVFLSGAASADIRNTRFVGNTGDMGGGVFSNGALNVTGCDFVENGASPGYGGAIASHDDLTVLLTDAVAGNTAGFGGGAFYALGELEVRFVADGVSRNAAQFGGVAYSAQASVVISDVAAAGGGAAVEGNTAVLMGGVAYAFEHATLERVTGAVRENKALQSDGGVLMGARGAVVRDIDGNLERNVAGTFGGVAASRDGFVLVERVVGDVRQNRAEGGALAGAREDVHVRDITGDVVGNAGFGSAETIGVVAFAQHNLVVERVVGAVAENHGGGAVFGANGYATLRACVGAFRDNAAGGGGVCGGEGALVEHNDMPFVRNRVREAGAGAVACSSAGSVRVVNNTGSWAGNEASPFGALVNALWDAEVEWLDGSVRGNTAASSDAVRRAEALVLALNGTATLRNVTGEVAENVAEGGVIVHGGAGVYVAYVAGDVRDNSAGLAASDAPHSLGVTVEHVGAVVRNRFTQYLVRAGGDGPVRVSDVRGDISRNEQTRTTRLAGCSTACGLVTAHGGAVTVQRVAGAIDSNVLRRGALLRSAFGALLLEDVAGDVANNTETEAHSTNEDSPKQSVLLHTDAGLSAVVRRVGALANNKGHGLVRAVNGTVVLEDVHGDISDNSVDAFAIAGGGSVEVRRVLGSIERNRGAGETRSGPLLATLFAAQFDVEVYNVTGHVRANECNDRCVSSLSGSVRILHVASITDNDVLAGGIIDEAVLRAAGDIEMQYVPGGVARNSHDNGYFAYSEGGDATLRDVGAVANNVLRGLLRAPQGLAALERVSGPIQGNMWMTSASPIGSPSVLDGRNAMVRDVSGVVAHNTMAHLLACTDDCLLADVPLGFIDNTCFIRNGAPDAAALARGRGAADTPLSATVRVRDIGPMLDNTCTLVRADEGMAVEVERVIGGVFGNKVPAPWIQSVGGSVVARDVHGGFSGNAYGALVNSEGSAGDVLIERWSGGVRSPMCDYYVTSGPNDALFASGRDLLVREWDGDIRDALCQQQSIFGAAGDIAIDQLTGSLLDNANDVSRSTAYLVYASVGSVHITAMRGDIARNQVYGVVYSDHGVLLSNCDGDIRDNALGGGVINTNGPLSLLNHTGSIENQFQCAGSLLSCDGTLRIEDMRGHIRWNYPAEHLIRAENGDVVLRNIHGDIAHNAVLFESTRSLVRAAITATAVVPHSFLLEGLRGSVSNNTVGEYASLFQLEHDAVVRDVRGDVSDNRCFRVFDTYGGDLEVSDLEGDVRDNACGFGAGRSVHVRAVNGSIARNEIHIKVPGPESPAAREAAFAVLTARLGDLSVTDVSGGIEDNVCRGDDGCRDPSECRKDRCRGGFAAALAGEVLIARVGGDVLGNAGRLGGVAYARSHVVVAEVRGAVRGNSARLSGGVVYSVEGTARIEDVGALTRNVAIEGDGGCADASSDVEIRDVRGPVAYNHAVIGRGGVALSRNGAVALENVAGAVLDNDARAGGVAWASEAVEIRHIGGDVRANRATEDGGVAYSGRAAVHVADVNGTIAANRAVSGHGGVACAVSDEAVIERVWGDVRDNDASVDDGRGGVAYASGQAVLRDVLGDVSGNHAAYGGGLYGGTAEVSGIAGAVRDNWALEEGGVVVGRVALVERVGGDVARNRAQGARGGVCAGDEECAVRHVNGSVADNAAGTVGGVAHASARATVSDVLGDVRGNGAGDDGGVVWAEVARVDHIGGDVVENHAGDSGGVAHGSIAAVSAVQGNIASNQAHTGDGGVVWAEYTAQILDAGTGVCSNEAFRHGGVLFSLRGNALLLGNGTKVTLNRVESGGGSVIFLFNRDNATLNAVLDLQGGFLSGNDPTPALDGRELGGGSVATSTSASSAPGSVSVSFQRGPSDAVANEGMRPAVVVSVGTLPGAVPVDLVVEALRVDDDSRPSFEVTQFELVALGGGDYALQNITLPEGTYRLRVYVPLGCGGGEDVLGSTAWSATFDVSACRDPSPAECPPAYIFVQADRSRCAAYVAVPDVTDHSPLCTEVTYENDLNGVSAGFGAAGDGTASGVFPVGVTNITRTLSTAAGVVLECPVQVEVQDNSLFEQVECPTHLLAGTAPGRCDADVDVPLPVVVDNCPVAISNSFTGRAGAASGTYGAGTTDVTYFVENDWDYRFCTFEVEVRDYEPPTITCPGDIALECSDPVAQYEVRAEDNCARKLQIESTEAPFNETGGVFPPGVTFLTFETVDRAGNRASCRFSVTVEGTFFEDKDGDGFGVANTATVFQCNAPDGWATRSGDCNDNDPTAHSIYFIDYDGDGHPDEGAPYCGTSTTVPPWAALQPNFIDGVTPRGFARGSASFDCDDTNPNVFDGCSSAAPAAPTPTPTPVPAPANQLAQHGMSSSSFVSPATFASKLEAFSDLLAAQMPPSTPSALDQVAVHSSSAFRLHGCSLVVFFFVCLSLFGTLMA